MATYKTPGVYVEEISTLPASVAQVDTAVPAFIGVTERAVKLGVEVKNQPIRITSLVEYQEVFGYGPPVDVTEVVLNSDNSFKSANFNTTYLLYNSLRMYFLNGGGECYITSIAYYTETFPSGSDFMDAIDALKKVDQPTLILYPDAVKFSSSANLYTLQDYTLAHCAKMQDRFAILDVLSTVNGPVTDAENFRNGVGMGNLKYGAAYYPYLNCNLELDVKYRDIQGALKRNGAAVAASDLTDSTDVKAQADRLDAIVADNQNVESKIVSLKDTSASIRDRSENLFQILQNANAADTPGKLADVMEFLNEFVATVDSLLKTGSPDILTDAGSSDQYYDKAKAYVSATYDGYYKQLKDIHKEAQSLSLTGYSPSLPAASSSAGFTNPYSATATTIYNAGGADDKVKVADGIDDLQALFENMYAGLLKIQEIGTSLEDSFETTIIEQIPAVQNAIRGVNNSLTTLPPSGAVAGVYARVDRNRGVWKAPANESIIGVNGLSHKITFEEQEKLNVDPTSGKSINAIRPFTGRGILVWGARTLAGNDNEWRYVPVRRLFITVEESIRKATEFVVFEPNDANTWVRVKGMIKNYLTELWKQGALAGAKADHAFFVNCGLGETMTAQDILEGRMIVEIGMAAVRPAEFIILRFSHKLQES